MKPIVQHDGVWWPEDDVTARTIVGGDCLSDVREFLTHVPERDVVIQAGGNVGLYPAALADHFSMVATFEPDPTNWECLQRNVKARDPLRRVVATQAGLGAEVGFCAPHEVHKNNCAAHRVDYGTGDVPATTIDALNLAKCSAIWLDIEGGEHFALIGGAKTIERFNPTIVIEDKGLETTFYGVPRGAMHGWLAERGYQPVARLGRWDTVFRRAR
jgi:FkbM family methyltransferase